LASYAEIGITGLMPSSGLCRLLRVGSQPVRYLPAQDTGPI